MFVDVPDDIQVYILQRWLVSLLLEYNGKEVIGIAGSQCLLMNK